MFSKSHQTEDSRQPFDYNVALRRVIYLAFFGIVFILIYSLGVARFGCGSFGSVFSVGLMAAGAAIVSGGLLGFLFGVPHAREDEAASSRSSKPESTNEQEGTSGTTDPSISYRPNTSLEQISDWLTKMLVGVGLIEIKVIPEKLKGMASYVAKGLGNNDQAQVFALTLLIFFSVCGFVFGFLWARLFLKRWFIEADQVRRLGEEVNRLKADARALALVTQELTRDQSEPRTDPKQITKAINAASSPVKAHIFSLAQEASSNKKADDYDAKVQAAISIFKGLIASDTRERYHRNHSELSYALKRQEPPDFKEAENEITRAIQVRDKLGKKGWKYYEFRRAEFRIEQDQNFKTRTGHSDPAVVEQVLKDLRAAYGETEKWQKWYESDPNIKEWLEFNKIDISRLDPS